MTYRLDQQAIPRGVGREGSLRAIPKRIRARFGEPKHWQGDDECLGNYIFCAEDGAIFTVYRMAYDVPAKKVAKLKSEFWDYSGVEDLHVGASKGASVETFMLWFQSQLLQP